MAKNPPKQQQEEVAEQAPPKRKRGKLILLAGLLLLVAGGGGAAWFFLSSPAGTQAEGAPRPAPSKPVFVNMDAFTVNLHPEVSDQYLQVVASLKVLNETASEAIKLHMPEIRHRILMLLSSKKASDINTMPGRQRLAEEMRYESNTVLWKAAGVTPPSAEERLKPIGTVPATAADLPQETQPEGAQDGQPPAASTASDGLTPLPEPAPDDPVQEVFFTSFIIQ